MFYKERVNNMNQKFEEAKQKVKELLKKVSADTGAEEMAAIKAQFKEVIRDANPLVIAAAEGELVKEGHTIEHLMKACEVHLELFKDVIRNPNLKVPEGHPIASFQQDHRDILDLMEKFVEAAKSASKKSSLADAAYDISVMEMTAQELMEAENHNVRQENTLFPLLEKHGIEQPPAIMWAEHTDMKDQKKALLKLLKERDSYTFGELMVKLQAQAIALLEKFAGHTQKEENILYVTALKTITENEWKDIKEECDNLGYFNKAKG